MPWTQKQMLRDANGDLIPQYWDVVEQEFKPLTGIGGANDVRLTGRKVQVKQITINSSEQVDTGSSSEIIIMPTSGYKAKIVSLYLNVSPPAGATTGNHMFFVYFDLDYTHRLLQIMGNYNISLLFRGNGASIGSSVTTMPSDLNAVINNLRGVEFTEAMPLKIKYTNNTDLAQTNIRSARLILVEEAIV
mgnify:FL=1